MLEVSGERMREVRGDFHVMNRRMVGVMDQQHALLLRVILRSTRTRTHQLTSVPSRKAVLLTPSTGRLSLHWIVLKHCTVPM